MNERIELQFLCLRKRTNPAAIQYKDEHGLLNIIIMELRISILLIMNILKAVR